MKAAITWMTHNSVAANLLMAVFIVGGLLFASTLTQELFPEIELDLVSVSVVYPGAAPNEVETGICLPIEEAVLAVVGVKEVRCIAAEGAGSATIELHADAEVDRVVQDIQSEIDRIQTFPEDAEDPVVAQVIPRKEVLSIAVYGDVSELVLRQYVEDIRNKLLDKPELSQIDISGMRDYEIAIEISENNLRKYGLTLEEVARRIKQASVDVPGGVVKTKGGEVLLRVNAKRYTGEEYRQIPIVSEADGSEVLLGELATVKDEFADTDISAAFDGKRAAMLDVFRVGKQGPVEMSKLIHDFVAQYQKTLPPGISIDVWNDRSKMFQSRKSLLIRNGIFGLILVFFSLGLFLELKLSLWVTMGIPISFLGALLFLPLTDVTINMISMFAFILSLGIVVDDAIIIGENIYSHRFHGEGRIAAAVHGAIEVAFSVIFSVLTSVAAFTPMLFVSGVMGKFMRVIPIIVISVLMISLFESLFILPAHLAHTKRIEPNHRWLGRIESQRIRLADWLEGFISAKFVPSVRLAIHWRYTTIAAGIALMLVMVGLLRGGYLRFVNMPAIDSDKIQVAIELPEGSSVEATRKVHDYVLKKSLQVIKDFDQKYKLPQSSLVHVYSRIAEAGGAGGPMPRSASAGSHLAAITFGLQESENRHFASGDLTNALREAVGEVAGAKSIRISSNLLHGTGDDLNFEFAHESFGVLNKISRSVKTYLGGIQGVGDISDNLSGGKREFKFKLRDEARSLGITDIMLGRQVRDAFYGAEALRLQRDRNEIKVLVRYPRSRRKTLSGIENLLIRTPDGTEIPFRQVAEIVDSQGFSTIRRTNRKRVINITASVDESQANAAEIVSQLESHEVPQLINDYPGLSYRVSGEEKERRESNQSLFRGFMFAMFIIYVLLAIPFRSYIQPFIVMSAIPFGIIGAFLGHLLLGHDISILSMAGIVALSGVVVNDSLIMVDYINRSRTNIRDIEEVVSLSAGRRFRQIILTSITTFLGLTPLILETSVQAQFLIPMAISLGFGVLFATLITLYLIPSFYMAVEDFKGLFVKTTSA